MLPRLSVYVFQLLKENEELRLLARSVMNETVDLRTGIQTAKSVNKQLHHENQVHPQGGARVSPWRLLTVCVQTILDASLQTGE